MTFALIHSPAGRLKLVRKGKSGRRMILVSRHIATAWSCESYCFLFKPETILTWRPLQPFSPMALRALELQELISPSSSPFPQEFHL